MRRVVLALPDLPRRVFAAMAGEELALLLLVSALASVAGSLSCIRRAPSASCRAVPCCQMLASRRCLVAVLSSLLVLGRGRCPGPDLVFP